MSKTMIDQQRKAYGETFQKYGATPMATFQNNAETQHLRFERLIFHLRDDLRKASIHDVGSGICDFHKYLSKNNIDHQYSGTEIVQEMNEYSLLQYPGIKLFNRNFLSMKNELYDFIFLSGTFNLKLNTSNAEWKKWSLEIIKKMFKHATKAISFNCLTTNNTFSQDNLMYFNPQELLDFCIKKLSRFVILDNSYPLYEFTLTVFKIEFIESKYTDSAFKKYFLHAK